MSKKTKTASRKTPAKPAAKNATKTAAPKTASRPAPKPQATNHFTNAMRASTAATESLRGLTEQAFSAGNVRDFVSNGSNQAKQAQEKIQAFTRRSAEKVSQSADAAGRNLQEAMATGRDMIEAYVECGNVATDMTKTVSTEMFNYANDSFTQNIEMSKDYFTCRTLNDMFELQNRILRANLDQYFSESAKLSNLFFNYATQASEPFSDRVASATERFGKNWAA